MRRAVAGFWWSPTTQGTPALVVTAAFFTLGALGGAMLALGASEGGADALEAYLEQFLTLARAGELTHPSFLMLLWRALRWPLFAFLFGFSALGVVLLPVLSSLRGFFLAFSIASFARSYARRGLAVSFLLLGVPGAVYLPVFFLLCTQSLGAAWSLLGRTSGQSRREIPYDRGYFLRCGVCAAAMLAGLFVEWAALPTLMAGVASGFAQ